MQKWGTRPPVTENAALRAWIGVILTAGIAVAIDQSTKSWARGALTNGRIIEIAGSLQLALTYNDGVAFGLGQGLAPVLITLAVGALIVMVIKNRLRLTTFSVAGVGLVLGGAVGNLCDRLFRNTGGKVVDFIDPPWWPVFNLADACIVVGALILIWSAGRREESIQ